MRILAIAATPFFSDRGCHIRILNEARYLQKMGAEVRLSTYHIGEDVPGLSIARIKGPKWYKKTSPGFSWGKLWLDFKLLFLTRREIRKFRPDAIHAHLYEGLAIGHLAKKLAFRGNIPIVFDLQGNLDEEFESYNKKNKFAKKMFSRLSKIVAKWADKIVVSSENIWKQNFQNGSFASIIPDGIDLDLFNNPQELSKNEQKKIESIENWKSGSRLLAYIGGLSDNKGVGELLNAFLRSDLKNRGWRLLLGGFGKDEKKYKKFVNENNLDKWVYFAGRVSYFSLPRYLALADAGIDPKKDSTESSGKLMNLAAAGLPIVCFDSKFNRARLGEKGNYLKNMDDLENALKNIQTGEKVKYDLENLSEEKEVKKLFEIFKSISAKNRQ
jgi:glycosyltransferase involved in cell wall biosynthesis